MKTVKFRLPYPPTVNHYWIRRKGSTKLCLSERARVFRSLVAVQTLKFLTGHKEIRDRNPVMRGYLPLFLDIVPPDNRRRDFDNVLKGTLDALVHAKLVRDDCDFKVSLIRMNPKDPEKQGYVDVVIKEILWP